MKYKLALLAIAFNISTYGQSSKITISGYVLELGSGEPLIGVNIILSDKLQVATTNDYGFYSISIDPIDTLKLIFSYVGFEKAQHTIELNDDLKLNVELIPNSILEEVVVTSSDEELISQTLQMSKTDIPIEFIKKSSMLFGEKDVMKVIQLIPGVQRGKEGMNELYVRGGGADQNLIILDEATVYNTSHLFGFFSLFNGDALKNVEVIKGAFPAQYGGRLSSIIKMNMKEGNKKQLKGAGGIGILSSRLTLEGPIIKDKVSFLLSGRRTYLDVLTLPFRNRDNYTTYAFYDLNAKVNMDIGIKSKLFISGYFGKDRAKMKQSFTYNNGFTQILQQSVSGFHWQNTTATIRWNYLISKKIFTNSSLIFSNYEFGLSEEKNDPNINYFINYNSGIRDYSLKSDWEYYPNINHHLKLGFSVTSHLFTPSALLLRNSNDGKINNFNEKASVLKSVLYVENIYHITDKLKMNSGFRINRVEVEEKKYSNIEPRIAISYHLKTNVAIKSSFSRMSQYVHMLSNTGIGLRTDLWVPVTDDVPPQTSWQIATGISVDNTRKNLAISIEGYYKKMENIVNYKENATFLLVSEPESIEGVENWADKITSGQGVSYGAELFVQRKTGRLTGWLGYTLSWTIQQFDSLNFGKKFYGGSDRRHDFSIVGSYNLSDKISISSNWVFSSGSRNTLPLAKYEAILHTVNIDEKAVTNFRTEYSERNDFKSPAYHRLDLSVQFHKEKKWGSRTWELGVYNIYARKNPWYYNIQFEHDRNSNSANAKLQEISIFTFIPSVSYAFNF